MSEKQSSDETESLSDEDWSKLLDFDLPNNDQTWLFCAEGDDPMKVINLEDLLKEHSTPQEGGKRGHVVDTRTIIKRPKKNHGTLFSHISSETNKPPCHVMKKEDNDEQNKENLVQNTDQALNLSSAGLTLKKYNSSAKITQNFLVQHMTQSTSSSIHDSVPSPKSSSTDVRSGTDSSESLQIRISQVSLNEPASAVINEGVPSSDRQNILREISRSETDKSESSSSKFSKEGTASTESGLFKRPSRRTNRRDSQTPYSPLEVTPCSSHVNRVQSNETSLLDNVSFPQSFFNEISFNESSEQENLNRRSSDSILHLSESTEHEDLNRRASDVSDSLILRISQSSLSESSTAVLIGDDTSRESVIIYDVQASGDFVAGDPPITIMETDLDNISHHSENVIHQLNTTYDMPVEIDRHAGGDHIVLFCQGFSPENISSIELGSKEVLTPFAKVDSGFSFKPKLESTPISSNKIDESHKLRSPQFDKLPEIQPTTSDTLHTSQIPTEDVEQAGLRDETFCIPKKTVPSPTKLVQPSISAEKHWPSRKLYYPTKIQSVQQEKGPQYKVRKSISHESLLSLEDVPVTKIPDKKDSQGKLASCSNLYKGPRFRSLPQGTSKLPSIGFRGGKCIHSSVPSLRAHAPSIPKESSTEPESTIPSTIRMHPHTPSHTQPSTSGIRPPTMGSRIPTKTRIPQLRGKKPE